MFKILFSGLADKSIRVFPVLCIIVNVFNKDLHREEQNKGSKKWRLNLVPLVFYSNAFVPELTWQTLIDRYLTSLQFVKQLTFPL